MSEEAKGHRHWCFPCQYNHSVELSLINTARYFIISMNNSLIKLPRHTRAGKQLPFWGHWNCSMQWLVGAREMSCSALSEKNSPERLIKTKTFTVITSRHSPPFCELFPTWSPDGVFHTVWLLSLCFIKGCDFIIFSFCMSWAPIWNWYNVSSDIGIIFCAGATVLSSCWRWWGNL